MSRPTHPAKTKIIVAVVAVAMLIGGAAADLAVHHQPSNPITTVVKSAPTTTVTYQGQEGKTALELLKQHAKVKTKSSSLGEFVTSINGNDGDGKKYWLYYVNNKEAQVGAGAYKTHKGETIQWRLK